MRSSKSRSHSRTLVGLVLEIEGLGDVDRLEVVLLESSAADVSLGDRGGKRAGNKAERGGIRVRCLSVKRIEIEKCVLTLASSTGSRRRRRGLPRVW